MEEVEERVSTLEAVLGQFIVQTEKVLKRMERDTAAFKEEVRRDQQQRDGDMKLFRKEVRRDQQQRDKSMKLFGEEIRHDQLTFKDTMNQRWGELANRLGTIVEDIVAPNLPVIAARYFDCAVIDTFALRVKKRNQVRQDNTKNSELEFDAILTCEHYLFINETKAKATSESVKSFVEKQVNKVFEYFPEYEGKTVVPIFSSLSIPKATLKYLTRNKVYAMSSKGDTMDLLNFDEVQKK